VVGGGGGGGVCLTGHLRCCGGMAMHNTHPGAPGRAGLRDGPGVGRAAGGPRPEGARAPRAPSELGLTCIIGPKSPAVAYSAIEIIRTSQGGLR
jgi:hypothetical protein